MRGQKLVVIQELTPRRLAERVSTNVRALNWSADEGNPKDNSLIKLKIPKVGRRAAIAQAEKQLDIEGSTGFPL